MRPIRLDYERGMGSITSFVEIRIRTRVLFYAEKRCVKLSSFLMFQEMQTECGLI